MHACAHAWAIIPCRASSKRARAKEAYGAWAQYRTLTLTQSSLCEWNVLGHGADGPVLVRPETLLKRAALQLSVSVQLTCHNIKTTIQFQIQGNKNHKVISNEFLLYISECKKKKNKQQHFFPLLAAR